MRFNTWLIKSLTGRKKIPRDAHFVRAQHRQRTCRSRTDEQKWHPAEAGSIVWQKQVQERNPDVFNPNTRGLGANTIQSTKTDWQQLLKLRQCLQILKVASITSPEEWNDRLCRILPWGQKEQSERQIFRLLSLIYNEKYSISTETSVLRAFM